MKSLELKIQTPVQTRLITSLLLTPNSCTDAINEPARCGESSAVGGFPAVGDW